MERLGDCMYRQICKYEQECSVQCDRYKRTKYFLDISGIPKDRQGFNELKPSASDVNAFKQLAEVKNNIDDFVDEGRILYLWSRNSGNGKTTWSIKLALQYINSIWQYYWETAPVIFISVPDFLYSCKCFGTSEEKAAQNLRTAAKNAQLVIFDDVGVDYISKYDYMALFSLIDVLTLNKKAMIFTSNYNKEDLEGIVGDRLPSRICNDIVVELKGMDRRGE